MKIDIAKVESKLADYRRLQDELARSEQELGKLLGSTNGNGNGKSHGKPRGRKKAAAAAATAVKRPRPAAAGAAAEAEGRKNEMPLTKLIPGHVLEGKEEGLTHAEIVKSVLGRGYKHSAQDFNNVVYQTLRKLVRGDAIVELQVAEGDEPRYALPQV